MPPLLLLGLRPMLATWWALLLLPALRMVSWGLLVPLLLDGPLPRLGTLWLAAAFLLSSCCRLGVLLLAGKPLEAFRVLRVPRLVAFPAGGAIGGSGLICLVMEDALLNLVRHAADNALDGVHTTSLEVVEALALVTPHRFSLVGAQGVFAPAAKVQLGGRLPHNDQ